MYDENMSIIAMFNVFDFEVKMSNSSSVYSPFSDRVGLPPHNTPFPGVLIKSIGAAFYDRMPFLMFV